MSRNSGNKQDPILKFERTIAQGHPSPFGLSSVSNPTTLLAVSGGADSVAMFRALHQLNESARPADRVRLVVCHLNHNLRGEEADQDATFVEELAQRYDLPCESERFEGDWKTAPDIKEGVEAAARAMRYTFFIRAASKWDADVVVTAHTADDQAETVLHRIVRGTGIAGLAGIPRRRELVKGVKSVERVKRVDLIRPLLDLTRADVLAYLEGLEQPYRVDSSNESDQFTRNRIRTTALPMLQREVGSNVSRSLVQLSESASEIQEAIGQLLDRLIERGAVDRTPEGSVFLPTNVLEDQPPYLVRELLVRVWREQGWPRRDMNRKHWTDLAAMLLARYEKPMRKILPGKLSATRTRYGLLLEPDPDSAPPKGDR